MGEGALASLPTFIRYGPYVVGPVFAFAVAFFATNATWRMAAPVLGGDTPWYERARLAHGARFASLASLIVFGALLAIGPAVWTTLSDWPRAIASLVGLGSFAGAWMGRFRAEQWVRGPHAASLREWWRGLGVVMLLGPHLFATLVTFVLYPDALDARFFAVLLGGLAYTAVMLFGVGLRGAVALGLARHDARLTRIALEVAAKHGRRPPRRIVVLDWHIANAYAFVLTNELAFTRAALAALDDAQVAAVCEHELEHLAEPKRNGVLRIAQAISFQLLATAIPVYMTFDGLGLLVLGLAVLGVRIVGRRVGSDMEKRADHAAEGGSGPIYGAALLKLFEVNAAPLVGRVKGVHGAAYDRIVSAGTTPPCPRPAPPPMGRARLVVAAMFLVVTFGVFVEMILPIVLPTSERIALVAMTIEGARLEWMEHVLDARYRRGDAEGALAIDDALESSPMLRDRENAVRRISLLAAAGRCDEARAMASEVEADLLAQSALDLVAECH